MPQTVNRKVHQLTEQQANRIGKRSGVAISDSKGQVLVAYVHECRIQPRARMAEWLCKCASLCENATMQ
eukprot:13544982-Heterocapsa_arctica.AAC.1